MFLAETDYNALLGIGSHVGLITSMFRYIFFVLDCIVYPISANLYGLIYSLYDINTLFQCDSSTGELCGSLGDLLKNLKQTIYSFLAIAMFFRLAFSLLQMLVDPAKVDDKEKGVSKLIRNVVICLALIVAVPALFKGARVVQYKVVEEHMIEQAITGNSYDKQKNTDFGTDLTISVWSMFISPTTDDTSEDAVIAYNNIFKNDSDESPLSNTGPLLQHLNNVSNGLDIAAWIPFGTVGNKIYCIAYVYILSTVVGIYLFWTFLNMTIDIAYRAIKFLVLELLSPIAIISYINPDSSKNGIFSKWLKETWKTYLSLFIRIFAFALGSVIMQQFDIAEFSGGWFTKLVFLIAVLTFVKNGPKFLDSILGTEISKDGDASEAKGMLRGALGATVGAAGAGISGATVAGINGLGFKQIMRGGWEGIKSGGKAGLNAGKKTNALGAGIGMVGAFVAGRDSAGKYFNLETGIARRRKKQDEMAAKADYDIMSKYKKDVSIGAGRKSAATNGNVTAAAQDISDVVAGSSLLTDLGSTDGGKHVDDIIMKLNNVTASDMRDKNLMVNRGKAIDSILAYQQLVVDGKITQEQADIMNMQAVLKFNAELAQRRVTEINDVSSQISGGSISDIDDIRQQVIKFNEKVLEAEKSGKYTDASGVVYTGADAIREAKLEAEASVHGLSKGELILELNREKTYISAEKSKIDADLSDAKGAAEYEKSKTSKGSTFLKNVDFYDKKNGAF